VSLQAKVVPEKAALSGLSNSAAADGLSRRFSMGTLMREKCLLLLAGTGCRMFLLAEEKTMARRL
jgi:hypothetical protein